MDTTSEKMSVQQSLDIITAMIDQAKGNAKQNSFYFLLWGWVAALANAGMYILQMFDFRHPYLVWIITIPAWLLSFYRGYRHKKVTPVFTHLDKITTWLWISFGITIFTLILFGNKINFQLNPLILLFCALPTFVSGIILKFKPLMAGGILFWIMGIVSFLLPLTVQPLMGAGAIVCGYLVPGYWLKNKREK